VLLWHTGGLVPALSALQGAGRGAA
jgi:hypothetical protein